jgi:hypothetical protein
VEDLVVADADVKRWRLTFQDEVDSTESYRRVARS